MLPQDQIEFDNKVAVLLEPLNSAEELRDWMHVFLDLQFPNGTVYPTSTHGPVEAMWRIYELMRTGQNEHVPQVCMLASRDSFKTLGAAALEVLCVLHFRISAAHMAAISSQSDKAIQYVNAFFRKLKPYLEANGWRQSSDNKKMVAWLTDELQEIYIRIVIATIAGANCLDPDTIVDTKEGQKKASEIKQGDYLKTYDFWNNEEIFVKVMTTGGVLSEARELVFDDGSNLITSVKHKVFTQRGWLNTGNLKVNDLVIGDSKHYHTLAKPHIPDDILRWSLENMIFGTLLGSAVLEKTPIGNYRYQISQSKKNLSFLNKIQQTFLDNNIESSIIEVNGEFTLFTEASKMFNLLHQICYKNNLKVPNDKWMGHIDAQSLAFLIMSSKDSYRDNFNRCDEVSIDIDLTNFQEEESNLIVNKIKELGYYCVLELFDKIKTLRIPIKESRDLTDDIGCYFVNCFKYKLCFGDDIRFAVDTGNHIDNTESSESFSWEESQKTSRKQKKIFTERIKQRLNKKITKINHLGSQSLVGIGIDPLLNFNIKSFYGNGVLVHNSEHVPMLFIDEVDVVQDPRALKEAKMIPSTFGKYYPLTVYLSTRKFAGGLMEQTLKQTLAAGGEILRWNILDVTERIPHDVAKTNEPRKIRYISRELPMEILKEEEWNILPDEKKNKYERLEAYAGIADHPLLPVMKNYLVDRSQEDVGGLFKKLSATLNNFKQLDSDMADAQLLCNKPASSGLVYPRFDEDKNVLSVQEAWEKISGLDTPCTFDNLKQYLIDLGIVFIGGADWGFTDYTSLVLLALLPGGEVWHLDTLAIQGLEIDDIVKYGKEYQDEWYVDKWYCDQNYPAYLKTLKRKAGMTCPKFTKDVSAGISALQGKIVDSLNVRRYFILDTANNKQTINCFGEYRWATDGKGEIIEGKPYHDKEGISDIMDSIRYPFQNLFTKGAKPRFGVAGAEQKDKQKKLINDAQDMKEIARNVNQDLMRNTISGLAVAQSSTSARKGGKRKILW